MQQNVACCCFSENLTSSLWALLRETGSERGHLPWVSSSWFVATDVYRRLRDCTHVKCAMQCKSRADMLVPCSRSSMLTFGDKLNSCSRVHGRSFIRLHECSPLENRCLVSFFVPAPPRRFLDFNRGPRLHRRAKLRSYSFHRILCVRVRLSLRLACRSGHVGGLGIHDIGLPIRRYVFHQVLAISGRVRYW